MKSFQAEANAGEEVRHVSSLVCKTPAAVRHATLAYIIHVSRSSSFKFQTLYRKAKSQKPKTKSTNYNTAYHVCSPRYDTESKA